MRIVLLCALALTGCAQAAGIIVTASLSSLSLPRDPRPPEETPEEAEARLDRTIEGSRARLWNALDVAGEPPCDVKARRTKGRTWRLDSCRGTLKCWAVGETGYRCEEPPAMPANAQL